MVNSKFVSTNGEIKKFSNKQNEPLLKNELAFVLSDVPNGRALARTFLVDKPNKYTLNQRIAGITPHSDIDAYYLYITMNRNRYFLQFDDGVKQTNLSLDDMQKYIEWYPKSIEQQQIGALFLEIDNLITLHQRKCFCKKYSWEQRKLEEICNRFDNLRVPVAANQREKGNIPYYGANGIQDYVKGFTHKGEFILIAEDGANDLKNYPVNYVNGLFWANNHVHVLQSKEKIGNNKFLKFCISRTNIEHLLVGGGRAKLNSNIMMNMDLKIPAIVEQEKIGNILFEIDNLITLHQRNYIFNYLMMLMLSLFYQYLYFLILELYVDMFFALLTYLHAPVCELHLQWKLQHIEVLMHVYASNHELKLLIYLHCYNVFLKYH